MPQEHLARVIARAEHVWDDRDAAAEWLSQPHPLLEGKTPLDTAISLEEAERVDTTLGRIFYGISA